MTGTNLCRPIFNPIFIESFIITRSSDTIIMITKCIVTKSVITKMVFITTSFTERRGGGGGGEEENYFI